MPSDHLPVDDQAPDLVLAEPAPPAAIPHAQQSGGGSPRRSRMSTGVAVLLGAAVAVAVMLGAFAFGRSSADTTVTSTPAEASFDAAAAPADDAEPPNDPSSGVATETSFVAISGDPLPAFTQPDPAVGTTAPGASGQGPDGTRTSIGPDGVGRLIGFFAHWCPHCQSELPAVTDWLTQSTLPEGIEVVAVSTAADANADNYPPSEWLNDWPSPAIMDDDAMTLANAYGVTSLPAWVAVDATGNVMYRTSGSLTTEQLVSLAAAVAPDSDGPPEFVVRASTVLQTAPVTISGDWLAAHSLPDSTLGSPAPTVAGVSFDGTPVSFGDDGVGRIIGFFAHWCPHCQNEVPEVVSWLEDTSLPEDVEVVAVSTGVNAEGANYPPSEWFPREQWQTPVLVDDEATRVAGAFGLTAYPYWVAVNAEGDVVYRASGALPIDQLEELVTAVTPGSTHTPSFIPTGVHRISADETAELLASPPQGLTILDVRTPEEFASGHLAGATNIDFFSETFWEEIQQLDPSKPYLLYCDSGNRSGQVFDVLAGAAWPELYDLDGGIQAWNAAGLDLTTP